MEKIPCCKLCNSLNNVVCIAFFSILLFHIFLNTQTTFTTCILSSHLFIGLPAKPHVNVQKDTRNLPCGTPSGVPNGLSQYIVGGSISNTDAWPWQVKCSLFSNLFVCLFGVFGGMGGWGWRGNCF